MSKYLARKMHFFVHLRCFFPILLLYIEYSWHIHGVFIGYSYVSVMYRLCVGYVSVMYRLCIGTDKERGGLLACAGGVEREHIAREEGHQILSQIKIATCRKCKWRLKGKYLRVCGSNYFSAFLAQDFLGADFLTSFLASLSCFSRRSISFSWF